MAIVLSCGMQTLLEDLKGRCGYMDIGVSRSGMLDDYAGRLLNALVGNDDLRAAIEIVGGGFTLEFQEETVIAVGGAKLPVTLNDSELPPYTAVAVQPGDVLKTGRFSKETRGFRQYVAVAGGVAADSYLGSTATATYGSFGGYQGRALRKGDVLTLAPLTDGARAAAGRAIRRDLIPEFTNRWVMRAIPGPDGAPDFFTEEGMEQFYTTEYKAQVFCDRSGIRLKGPKPLWAPERTAAGGHPSNITDHGYPGPGCVNVSGDTLILFPREGPTCGGLVCALSVIRADQWMLGQIIPGRDTICFTYATQADAIAAARTRNQLFEQGDIFE